MSKGTKTRRLRDKAALWGSSQTLTAHTYGGRIYPIPAWQEEWRQNGKQLVHIIEIVH